MTDKPKKRLGCQECGGAGGYKEAILDDGTGPFFDCGWCNGTGEMTPEDRGKWLQCKKLEKKQREACS